MVRFGLTALACYAIHGGYHLGHGRPAEMLWACHLGAALIGVGLLTCRPAVNGIGTLFLCLGTPLWLRFLANGGEFHPTSFLTHIVALVIGLYGVRRLGLPAGAWWLASGALLMLIGLCRLVTPPESNINAAFAIDPGLETHFPSHPVYLALMMAVATGYFLLVTLLLRRCFAGRLARDAQP